MFQREVADRIIAAPGTGAYGRLSILCQWRSTAKLAMPVHRSAFTPPPKVMSAVVHLMPITAPVGANIKVIERVTAAAFGARRKMLRQSLKSLPHALDCANRLGIDTARRAETLNIEEFIALSQELVRVSSLNP